MRAFATIAGFVLLFAPTHGQQPGGLDQRVSVRQQAARLPNALENLSQETGVRLEAAPFFANDVVMVTVRDRPLKDVLDKIAEVVSGEWRVVEGVRVLGRNQAKLQEEERRSLEQRIASVRTAQAKAAELLAAPYTFDSLQDALLRRDDIEKRGGESLTTDQYMALQRIASLGPVQRAALRLFVTLDPKVVGGLPPRGRVVFSTSPTAMQRQLTGSAIARKLLEEQALWADVHQSGAHSDTRIFFGPTEAPTRPFTRGIAKFRITAERTHWSDIPSVTFSVVAEDGRVMAHTSIDLWSLTYTKPAEQPTTPSQPNEPIPLSDSAKEFLEFALKRSGSPGASATYNPVPAGLRERLLNPERHDPLSFLISEALQFMVDRREIDFVGLIPDNLAVSVGMREGDTRITTAMLGRRIGRLLHEDETEKWLTLRPADPYRERSMRIDRAALGELLRSVAQHGRMTLDAAAAFVLKSAPPSYGWIRLASAMIEPSGEYDFWQRGDVDALRLYGTLSAQQRQLLASGGRLAISTLAPVQMELIRKLTFGADAQLNRGGASVEVEVTEGEYLGPSTEVTEVLPRGIPNDAFLTLASDESTVLYSFDSKEDNPYSAGYELDAIASQLFFRSRPDLFPWISDFPDLELFRAAKRVQWNLKVQFTEEAFAHYELTDDAMLTKGLPVRRDKLPADIERQIQMHIKKLEDVYKDIKPAQPGSLSAPPPTP